MKKLLLAFGLITLASALGLRGYFAFVPPPEATLSTPIAEIIPQQLVGWKIEDKEMADSPESAARISEFLNFDDALFRVFKKGDIFVALYIAYWRPGTASYRWAGAHTPDTCWVQAGWTCTDREYSIPFKNENTEFQPAEFGIYEKEGYAQQVYFWHLVGGKSFSYEQQGGHNIFGALLDIKHHGLNLREEQFFIRLSSNTDLKSLKNTEGFRQILSSLKELGLSNSVEM